MTLPGTHATKSRIFGALGASDPGSSELLDERGTQRGPCSPLRGYEHTLAAACKTCIMRACSPFENWEHPVAHHSALQTRSFLEPRMEPPRSRQVSPVRTPSGTPRCHPPDPAEGNVGSTVPWQSRPRPSADSCGGPAWHRRQ